MARALLKGKDLEDFLNIYTDARGYSIKLWYIQEFPSDELGKDLNGEINFAQLYILMKKGVPFNALIGVDDSVVRQRIFEALHRIFNLPHTKIYDMWF